MADWLLTHRRTLIVLTALAVGLLAIEIITLAPRAILVWQPWDYGNYLKMGNAIRQGESPYGPDRYYPLPTMLWIFAPLSLMPEWFKLIWALLPFVFVLLLFRLRGVLWFLFPPLWFVVTDAMFDAWLLFPFAWLLENRPIWAGVGAAVLLFKPHVTLFVVGYMLWRWLVTRDWRNLKSFAGAMAVLWLPSFVVNPFWVGQMLTVLGTRADQISMLPLLTSSLWSWWWLDGWARLMFVVLLLASGVLFWRAFRRDTQRAAAIQLLALLLNPVMLASNLMMVLPMVRARGAIVAIVIAALLAYALDRAMGAFGGGYALVALVALYFLNRGQDHLAGETNQ